MTITTDDLIEIHEILVDWFAASEDPVAPLGVRNNDLKWRIYRNGSKQTHGES